MALIKYGPAIADARGSVGGTVFSRNSAGAYMKQRTVPTYPASAKQIARAALMSTLIDDWKNSLTTAQRAAWNALAAGTKIPNKLGEQMSPSGANLFVRSNVLLDLSSQAHITAPPVTATAPAPTLTLAWTTAVGVQVTAIGNWDNSPSGKLLIQRSYARPLSRNYYKGPYENIGIHDFGDYAGLPVLIASSAQLTATSRFFCRIRAVHADGMISFPALFQADVGTPA